MDLNRCAWCCDGDILQKYHDEEWGICVHDDRRHFEYLLMEAMQCGLNWKMMLKKREIFRECFADFDVHKVASFDDADVERILAVPGMIRSRRKILAIIENARCFEQVAREWGSFDRYIWSFTNGETWVYPKHHRGAWETRNELSDRVSADLKKRGFRFLGSVTVYSYLQSCGMINDHAPECWMYPKLMSGNVRIIDELEGEGS